MTAFNDRLKALRKQKGLSQRALAEKLEMSKSAVSMYESGFREPDHETTEKIADFFNVDVDYLLGRSNVTLRYTDVLADGQPPQYYDDETVQIVTDRLRTNPEYSVLFKASADVKPENIEYVAELIKKLSD